MRNILAFDGSRVLTAMTPAAGQGSQAANESLWEASRAGDTARITAALGQGADVNAKARYDVTPLIFAAGNGRLDAVKLLLVARCRRQRAGHVLSRARSRHGDGQWLLDVAIFLVQNGSDADSALAAGVQMNQEALVKAALAGKVTRQGLQSAMAMAGTMKRESLCSRSSRHRSTSCRPRQRRSACIRGQPDHASEVRRDVPRHRERSHDDGDAGQRHADVAVARSAGGPSRSVGGERVPRRRGQCDVDVQRARRAWSSRSASCKDLPT